MPYQKIIFGWVLHFNDCSLGCVSLFSNRMGATLARMSTVAACVRMSTVAAIRRITAALRPADIRMNVSAVQSLSLKRVLELLSEPFFVNAI